MKTSTYHEDAIKYNQTLAEASEKLSLDLEDETVKKWCASVGRQHRFHENRHRSALEKIQAEEVESKVESKVDVESVENDEKKDS